MSGIEKDTINFGNLTKFNVLRMFESEHLEEFRLGVSNLLVLEELDFARCRALKSTPESSGNLQNSKYYTCLTVMLWKSFF